jgi:hypothetical protein
MRTENGPGTWHEGAVQLTLHCRFVAQRHQEKTVMWEAFCEFGPTIARCEFGPIIAHCDSSGGTDSSLFFKVDRVITLRPHHAMESEQVLQARAATHNRTRRPLSMEARSFLSDLRANGYKGPLLKTTPAVPSHEPINEKYTLKFSTDNTAELTQLHDELAKQTEDPVLVQLDTDYKGKLLHDFEDSLEDADLATLDVDPECKRTHQVLEITHDEKGGSPCYQVDCCEVRMQADGSWLPVPDHYNEVEGERMFKAGKLWHCRVVCLKNPDNTERDPWVDEYIDAHKKRGGVPAD